MATKFQQRHYEAFALMVQELREREHIRGEAVTLTDVENATADMFRRDSGAFDRTRFHRACEIGANVKARTA